MKGGRGKEREGTGRGKKRGRQRGRQGEMGRGGREERERGDREVAECSQLIEYHNTMERLDDSQMHSQLIKITILFASLKTPKFR